jgi:hypothetical protein
VESGKKGKRKWEAGSSKLKDSGKWKVGKKKVESGK